MINRLLIILDLSMPYFVKYSMIAKNKLINNFTIDNLAVRFSDKEPIEYALVYKSCKMGLGRLF